MEGIAERCGRKMALVDVLTVALVDDNAVAYLHYSALDALKFVARTGKLYEQKEVYHGMTSRLTLPHPDSLYEYIVETGSLAEYYCLTRLAGHTAKRAGRRAGTYER